MPDNWAKASCTLKMFFIGVHTPWVPKDKSSLEGKVDDESNKHEVMWLLYPKLAPMYQYLGNNVTLAQDLWTKCVDAFKVSNMTSHINARPIEDTVTCLDRLGMKPTDSEIVDTLLMNLNKSLSSTRTTILTSKKEPILTAIKSQICNAQPFIPL
ncbi:hypothetical protein B0H14DRAFT_3499211 [Mycena olivaceomarginata]|nr:hypothetical protein B0H14DRAFT_3499211 [Mycena olivaceomarginata]